VLVHSASGALHQIACGDTLDVDAGNGEHEDRTLSHGYKAKRHAAMQAFAPCIVRCG